MLILERKYNEGVTITVRGIRIHVIIQDMLEKKVKLGIEAPEEVSINRDEIQALIDRTVINK